MFISTQETTFAQRPSRLHAQFRGMLIGVTIAVLSINIGIMWNYHTIETHAECSPQHPNRCQAANVAAAAWAGLDPAAV